MADIVTRLRRHAEKAVGHWEDYANATDSIVREAADEIEQLRDRANEAVRAANALQVEVDQIRATPPSPQTNVGLLKAAEAVVDAYDARGDMPAAVSTLETELRKFGLCLPLKDIEPIDNRHNFVPHKKYPWFCACCGYAPHEPLKHFQPISATEGQPDA